MVGYALGVEGGSKRMNLSLIEKDSQEINGSAHLFLCTAIEFTISSGFIFPTAFQLDIGEGELCIVFSFRSSCDISLLFHSKPLTCSYFWSWYVADPDVFLFPGVL